MRVTNNMMMKSMAANLQKKTQSILDLNEKVSTGKKISRPSDDPLGMVRAMDYKETISKVDQYRENISRGKTKLEVSENILEEVENQIISAKQIATDQSMGVLETRSTAATVVNNLYEQMFNLANSEFENNYLFGGHQTNSEPFTRNPDDSVTYNGDDGEQEIIVGKNNHVKINSHGHEIFGDPADPESVDIFNAFQGLIEGLENPDTELGTQQIRDSIALLETSQNQVNTSRTRNAGTYERLDSSEAYWENFKSGIEDQLSKVQDADLTQSVVELQNAQLIYQTSVSLSKEIMQNNLLSFLG